MIGPIEANPRYALAALLLLSLLAILLLGLAPPAPSKKVQKRDAESDRAATDANKHARIEVHDRAAWARALRQPRPVLVHLNADTTWLVQLPYPPGADRPAGRTRFNILLDPWLVGPQSDVAAWFSTQWHQVAPSVRSLAELDGILAGLEKEGDEAAAAAAAAAPNPSSSSSPSESHIDAVVISHEFTDHCHQATLLELPRRTPVFATDKAADLVRSWAHFDAVQTTPALAPGAAADWRAALCPPPALLLLPPWLRVGRAVTAGNALYYHSAVLICFDLSGPSACASASPAAESIIYSPHGIRPTDLAGLCEAGTGTGTGTAGCSAPRTLALLHGLDDVRIWATAQLNLGAPNGVRAARACGARYWVATHDEVKRGGGLVALLLRRTRWTLRDAVGAAEARAGPGGPGAEDPGYDFVDLGSGHGIVLT